MNYFFKIKNLIANFCKKVLKTAIDNSPNSDVTYTKVREMVLYKRVNGYPTLLKKHLNTYLTNFKFKRFEAEIGITAIIKNEAPYIKEWIEFHKLVGVGKFFIYDNESTDNIKEVLKPYIESNEVIYKYFPGETAQTSAYQHSVDNNSNKVKYMAFIDLDEFITPLKHDTIIEFLHSVKHKIGRDFDSIGINWLIHGFNGHYDKPDGLVCENFKNCSFKTERNKHIKSIVNPRSIISAHHPHYFIHRFGAKIINSKGEDMYGPFSEPCFDEILINHYFTKSFSEYEQRYKKGKADGSTALKLTYTPDFLSEDEDNSMERFILQLKAKL